MNLVALWHVGSSWTRDRTYVPSLGRQILNRWTTREGLTKLLLTYVFISSMDKMLVIVYNSKEEWKEKSLQGTFFWKLNCVRVLCSYGHGNAEADKTREFLSWGPWDHSQVSLGYPETPPILSHLKKPFAAVAAVQPLNWVWLFVAPWTVTHQAPLSMGFSRQEYWRGLPFPSLEDLLKVFFQV